MAVYIVSDLHGAVDPLRKAVPEGGTVLLLGDLLNVIDYFEMSGILVDIFGHEPVAKVNELRLAGDLEAARRVMKERSEGRQDEIREVFGRLAADEYSEVFSALPEPTYTILGNVDVPVLANSIADGAPGVHMVDGQIVDIDGQRVAFAGGALPTPLHVAGEITEEEMKGKIDALGECDVLCTHVPPALPELCYDTLAGREEKGSSDILRYIEDVQPVRHYFGHVHQPLLSSLRVGRTLCVNVGYFRRTKRAYPHRREAREDT